MRHLLLLALGFGVAACAGPVPQPAPTPTVDLVLAATTDVHGRVRGWDYFADAADPVRGLTRAATIVDSVRAANPGRVILVDAGDLLQGNPFTYVAARVAPAEPHPVIAAMNLLAYDAAVVGNHEFNYGLETFDRAVGQARFPFLAANAYRPDGARAYRPYVVVERAGVRVAIVGATTPGSMVWDRDNLRARLVIRDIVPEVRTAVADARRAGADVVIVGLHSGLAEPSSYDTAATGLPSENVAARVAREVPGIDAIVFGHSHKEVADTSIAGVLLVQPKNWATSVAIAHLAVAKENGRWRVVARRGALVRAAGHAEQPAMLAATAAAHARTVAYATTPIGSTAVAWRADSARVADVPLVDFILEVERRATGAQLASTAAFSLDASLAAGPITVAQVAALYPYDNTLRVVRLDGAQVRAYLEQSARYFKADTGERIVDDQVPGFNYDIVAGVDYTIDVSRPIGQRVTRLLYQGRPVAASDTFTMALNNYRQTGGGGFSMLARAPVIADRGLEIRQLLIDEVKARGTLRPEDYAHRNYVLEPASLVSRAYAEMNRAEGRAGARPPRIAPPQRPNDATPGIPRGAPTLPPGPRLRIVSLNDFHGALEPRPDANGVMRGGAAALAAYIRRARSECAPPQCQSIVLDGGDEFQGTPASNLAYGRTVVPIFQRMDVAAGALGNHEFDWGQDTLRARMRQARYRILGANARTERGRDVPWIRDDTIVSRGRVKVGVIGVATVETKRTTRAVNTLGLQFLDPAPIVDSLSQALRRRGATVVVVVAHAGAFCGRDGRAACDGEIVDLARRLTKPVDAIVSGHTHSLVDTEVNGIPIVQARSSGSAIAVLDIPLDGAGTPVAGPRARRVLDVLTDSVAPDTAVARLVTAATRAVAARVGRPVATIATAMNREGAEYPLGDLIADAMRAAGKADVGAMNNGGIRAPLRAGVATYGSLFEIQPFGNVLYRVVVRGADLRAWLERRVARARPDVHLSGVHVEYDTARAPGSRITAVDVGGRPLDDARRYTVVINDFMLTGGDDIGFDKAALERRSLEIADLDALIEHLGRLPQPVQPPTDRRFVVRTTQ